MWEKFIAACNSPSAMAFSGWFTDHLGTILLFSLFSFFAIYLSIKFLSWLNYEIEVANRPIDEQCRQRMQNERDWELGRKFKWPGKRFVPPLFTVIGQKKVGRGRMEGAMYYIFHYQSLPFERYKSYFPTMSLYNRAVALFLKGKRPIISKRQDWSNLVPGTWLSWEETNHGNNLKWWSEPEDSGLVEEASIEEIKEVEAMTSNQREIKYMLEHSTSFVCSNCKRVYDLVKNNSCPGCSCPASFR